MMRSVLVAMVGLVAAAGVVEAQPGPSRCEAACNKMASCKIAASAQTCIKRCVDDGMDKDPDGIAFLDETARSTCEALAGDKPTPAAPTGDAPAGDIETDYTVPTGYTTSRMGGAIVLSPPKATAASKPGVHACEYGLLPSRTSTGSLESDAKAALVEVTPGWRRGNFEQSLKGAHPDGWPYFTYAATVIQTNHDGSATYLNVAVTTFPATKGKVNVVYGYGAASECHADDVVFERLFHTLKPRGWRPDPEAFKRVIAGTWQLSVGNNKLRYMFSKDGRYMKVLHTVTTVVWTETTRTGSGDGSWTFKDGVITLQPDRGAASRMKFRPYEKLIAGKWWRQAAVLTEGNSQAVEYEYLPGG